MTSKQFATAAGTVFTIVGIAHLLRVINGWPLIIGSWEAPLWPSVLAVLLAGFLAFTAWRLRS